ncbi:MAG: protein kinase [Myxococcales bacterium]|nr:protein kinase [Myxococcales bacterium]
MDALIAGRYRSLGLLGEEAAARVLRVQDTESGRELALKRLDPERAGEFERAIFERAYYSLVDIDHPHIVRVYDYGFDGDAPFYTMELLDGPELSERAPLPPAEVVVILRQLASALSALHARRLLHRDLSLGNVACDAHGRYRLIDFGTLAPMGPAAEPVGTPPYMAPEVLGGDTLDARADLFALGALGYFLLTRRHAYGASELSQLHNLWRSRPVAPSHFDPSVPAALDGLIMGLLSLSPSRRPLSAGEVEARLIQIEGPAQNPDAEADGQSRDARRQAPLPLPALCGRDSLLSLLRSELLQLRRGWGSSILVRAAVGMGRSHLLDRIALEGRLLGAAVLRAQGGQGQGGDFGVIRALVRDLLMLAPGLLPPSAGSDAPALSAAVPELGAALGVDAPGPAADAEQERPRALSALHHFFLELSESRPLMLVVDDVERCDEPSLAVLALLSRITGTRRIFFICSAPSRAPERPPPGFGALEDHCRRIDLPPLNERDLLSLIGSLFGQSPNAAALATTLHRASMGNPGTAMHILQQLLERGVIGASDGRYEIPPQVTADALPRSLEAELEARLAKLEADPRQLAEALALWPEASSAGELQALHPSWPAQRVHRALSQLLGATVLQGSRAGHAFVHPHLARCLGRAMAPARRREIHTHIAQRLSERRAHPLRQAEQLLLAGLEDQAVKTVLDHIYALEDQAVVVEAELLPIVSHVVEQALDACLRLSRPPREATALRLYLVGIALYIDPELAERHGLELERSFLEDSGLSRWDEYDSQLSAMERLGQCLEWAQARYDQTPPERRGLAPAKSLEQLGRYVLYAIGPAAALTDSARIGRLRALIEKLEPLIPAMALIGRIAECTADLAAGRNERAETKLWPTLMEIRAGRMGLSDSATGSLERALLYAMALSSLSRTEPRVQRWADELERDPLFRVNAAQLRRLSALGRADLRQAGRCAAEIDAMALQGGGARTLVGSEAVVEMRFAVLLGDLTLVRRSLELLRDLSQRFPGYAALRDDCEGIYHVLSGDPEAGRLHLERCLAVSEPDRDMIWGIAIDDYLAVALELDGPEHTLPEIEDAVAMSEAAELDVRQHTRLVALEGLCRTMLDDHERGLKLVERAVADTQRAELAPLQSAETLRRAALAALEADDGVRFARYAAILDDITRQVPSPVLRDRQRDLMRRARGQDLRVPGEVEEPRRDRTQRAGPRSRRPRPPR